MYFRSGQKLTGSLETARDRESAYLEVSQVLQLEAVGRNRDARTGAEDPQENGFAVSENFENEKGKSIATTYHVSDLTLLNVVEFV